LGGFANATFLPISDDVNSVTECDVCPCNQIVDYCARKVLHKPLDSNGERAEKGTVDTSAYEELITLLKKYKFIF